MLEQFFWVSEDMMPCGDQFFFEPDNSVPVFDQFFLTPFPNRQTGTSFLPISFGFLNIRVSMRPVFDQSDFGPISRY